jgi:hypothetical protein
MVCIATPGKATACAGAGRFGTALASPFYQWRREYKMAGDIRLMANSDIGGDNNGNGGERYEGMSLANGQSGSQLVPKKPTARMLAAGARAGDVSVEVAWKVYQAMLQEAE